MRKFPTLLMLGVATSVSGAAVPTPERPLTDPLSVVSTAGPALAISPEDLVSSRTATDAAWSTDGREIFVISDLGGRQNVWRTTADGGWPRPVTRVDQGQSSLEATPDGQSLLYAQDVGSDEMHDVYRVPQGGGTPINLTATPQISEKAILVSPDGRTIAFTYKPISRSQRDIAIMDLATRAVRNLTQETDPEGVWSPVAWSSDSTRLLLNREVTLLGGDAAVWQADVRTGALEPVIPARKPGRDLAVGWVDNGRTLVLTTDSGSTQLRAALYDLASRSYRWLPPTPWEQRAEAISPDTKSILVSTSVDGTGRLSVVDTTTLTERALELGEGVNTPMGSAPFSPDSSKFLYSNSAGGSPPDLRVYDLVSGRASVIARFAPAVLSPGILPRSRVVTYRSFDGTMVSGILTIPFNLKRDGSHPALVMPHGGPTGVSRDNFSRKVSYLASRGYMVLQPNYRGSTGYGKAFQDAEILDMGGGDLRDVVAAKDFLVSTGYVDPRQVGITGSSAGGWLTMLALGKHPGVFAAAVQVYGVIDWMTFMQRTDPLLGAYIRRLLGDPVKDRDKYLTAAPLTYLENMNVPLLTLHGDRDSRVPLEQALQVRDALKQRGVTSETVIYPDEGHGGFKKPANQLDELRRTVDWFDRYLRRTPVR